MILRNLSTISSNHKAISYRGTEIMRIFSQKLMLCYSTLIFGKNSFSTLIKNSIMYFIKWKDAIAFSKIRILPLRKLNCKQFTAGIVAILHARRISQKVASMSPAPLRITSSIDYVRGSMPRLVSVNRFIVLASMSPVAGATRGSSQCRSFPPLSNSIFGEFYVYEKCPDLLVKPLDR